LFLGLAGNQWMLCGGLRLTQMDLTLMPRNLVESVEA